MTATLAEQTQLVQLTLGHNKITDAGLIRLKDLTKLQRLNLFFLELDGSDFEHLADMQDLENL